MRLSSSTAIYFLAALNRASATWLLEFYTTGCPTEGTIGEGVGAISGEPGQELWCIDTNSAHNVVATGIEADGMTVTLFSDFECTAVIAAFDVDGCAVIPSDTVIATARILPK